MSTPVRDRFRGLLLPAALIGVGAGSALFSPAREHGVLDVVAVASASASYACLVGSMVLTKPPRALHRWLGGGSAVRRTELVTFASCCVTGAVYVGTIWFPILQTLRPLDPYGPHVPTVPAAIVAAFGLGALLLTRITRRRWEAADAFVRPLTWTVFAAATVQFSTAATLLVRLDTPHGAVMIGLAAIGLAAVVSQLGDGRRRAGSAG